MDTPETTENAEETQVTLEVTPTEEEKPAEEAAVETASEESNEDTEKQTGEDERWAQLNEQLSNIQKELNSLKKRMPAEPPKKSSLAAAPSVETTDLTISSPPAERALERRKRLQRRARGGKRLQRLKRRGSAKPKERQQT